MTGSNGRDLEPARRPGEAEGYAGSPALAHRPIALVDLLDRVLAGGVVIMGDIRLAIADVDLVTISLQALISSVRTGLGDTLNPPLGQRRPGPPAGQHRPADTGGGDDW